MKPKRIHTSHIQALRHGLRDQGYTILQPFSVRAYNAAVPSYPLSDFGRTGDVQGILIGNTYQLWLPFKAALRGEHAALLNPATTTNPLDMYTKTCITRCVQEAVPDIQHDIRFSFESLESGRFVHMQKLAHESGLAFFDNTCFLCFHPVFGPWLALRAAVVFDAPVNPDILTRPIPHPAPESSSVLADKLERILQGEDADQRRIRESWQQWVELRDLAASYVGHAYRYSSEQIRYHYEPNVDFLRDCVNQ
eukprot:gb/GECH01014235.1/.p1 GENE.gb/GECH01014235.1/~~gb/GECH01014235.1/.p1  ORF type:complete len:251 (+),score=39.17 gb/GECH01014235.1/:1-753(+)